MNALIQRSRVNSTDGLIRAPLYANCQVWFSMQRIAIGNNVLERFLRRGECGDMFNHWRSAVASSAFFLLIAICSSVQWIMPPLQQSILLDAQNILVEFPELQVSVDGRDVAVVSDPTRPTPKELPDLVANIKRITGVRTVTFEESKVLPVVFDEQSKDAVDLPRFDSEKRLVVDLSKGNRINFNAVLQLAFVPQWSRLLDDDPCLLSFGNLETTEYAICVSGNRQNVTFQNDEGIAYLPYDFSEERVYVLEAVVNDDVTEVFIDGKSIGTAQAGFGSPSVQQMNVGTFDGVATLFEGRLGRLRVWNRGSRELLTAVAAPNVLPQWSMPNAGFTPHFDNLVASSFVKTDGSLGVTVFPQVTDPVGFWYAPSEAAARRLDKLELSAPEFRWLGDAPAKGQHGNYASYKVLKISRLPSGELEVRADHGGLDQNWAKLNWAKPMRFSRVEAGYMMEAIDGKTRLSNATGAGQFSLLNNRQGDGASLSLDGFLKLVPFEFKEPVNTGEDKRDSWESTFVNPEQIKNWFYSFAGFDITQMNPINFGDMEGIRAPVFARPGPDNADYKSTGEGRFSPAQLFFKPLFSAETENTVQISNSERELQTSVSRSLGANIGLEGVGGLSGSHSMTKQFENMSQTSYQTGYGESRVLHYALVQDKARMKLAESFSNDVSRLLQNIGNPAAFESFIRKYGTHYPYAITYGGKVHVQFRKKLTARKAAQSTTEETKIEAEGVVEGVKAGGNFSFGNTDGSKVGSETGIEVTKTVVVGGRGSATLDGFEIQDTVVPIYTDLRPLSDLLSPLFFDDDKITDVLQPALASAIETYRRKFRATDQGNLTRVAVHISKITCVDDGDESFEYGIRNMSVTKKLGLGKAGGFFDKLLGLATKAESALGLPVYESADKPDTCELFGRVSALLTSNNRIIHPETLRAFPGPTLDKLDVFTLAQSGLPYAATWGTDVDGGSNPLDINATEAFAMVPTNESSELNMAVPKDKKGNYSILLSAAFAEIDEVDVKEDDKVIKRLKFKLPAFGTMEIPITQGSGTKTLRLKVAGTCTPDGLFVCREAPFSAKIAGLIEVQLDVVVLD
jgi:MAC/Perforin domain